MGSLRLSKAVWIPQLPMYIKSQISHRRTGVSLVLPDSQHSSHFWASTSPTVLCGPFTTAWWRGHLRRPMSLAMNCRDHLTTRFLLLGFHPFALSPEGKLWLSGLVIRLFNILSYLIVPALPGAGKRYSTQAQSGPPLDCVNKVPLAHSHANSFLSVATRQYSGWADATATLRLAKPRILCLTPSRGCRPLL